MPSLDTSSRPGKAIKRIVVLSDGTWQTLETKVATNIRRLAMSLKYEDSAGVQQVVYYDPGVGTNGGADTLTGGALGAGIDRNIQQLYTFLALNYEPGDELYIFGFSRGAYTVRSLVGLVHTCGLVRRDAVELVDDAYRLYRTHVKRGQKAAAEFRAAHAREVDVTLLACFDTVAALGLPLGFLSNFNKKEYGFHDPCLNSNVKNAIHCLSVDEEREGYTPTLMKPHGDIGPTQLTQKWFWGAHSGVGGGDGAELESAKVALHFMVAEIKRRGLGLEFRPDALPKSFNLEARQVRAPGGLMDWVQRAAGVGPRNIPALDDLHSSVLSRYRAVAEYRPAALEKYKDAILGGGAN